MDAAGNGGGGTAAKRKAENRDGERRGEALKLFECGLSVHFALDPVDAAGTAAISRVVENQRGDALRGKELLDGEPAADGFSNAVTNEDCCARRACGRLGKHCVNDVLSAGDGMPGNGLIGECAAWTDAEQIEGPISPEARRLEPLLMSRC
jgi:hypothetical protein